MTDLTRIAELSAQGHGDRHIAREGTPLIRYEAACRALAEAKSVDEVKEISNRAEALRAYARQAKNRNMEVDAAEIRIRAERRLGEMLQSGKKSGDLHERGKPSKKDKRITLKEAGINHKQASRSQRLAKQPQESFETQISEWRERSLHSGKLVTQDLNAVHIPTPRKRGVVQGAPFKIPARDIRNMRVGEIRALIAFLTAIVDHCGATHDGAVIRECVSDVKIVEIAGVP